MSKPYGFRLLDYRGATIEIHADQVTIESGSYVFTRDGALECIYSPHFVRCVWPLTDPFLEDPFGEDDEESELPERER